MLYRRSLPPGNILSAPVAGGTHTPSVLHPHREAIIKAFLNKSKSLKDIDTEFHIVNRNIKSIIKEYATKWHVFDFTKSIYNMILTKVNSGG